MQTRLPKAVAANGGKINVLIKYHYQIPGDFGNRTDYNQTKNGKIYEIAQWFPRLCVYDDSVGWDTLPFLGAGEFYLEYGDIDYRVTHPRPKDFFRSMENGCGEDLNWYWKGWFYNNWKLDLAIHDVQYIKTDDKRSIHITDVNLEKMAMPFVVEITLKDGSKHRQTFPIETWLQNKVFTFEMLVTQDVLQVQVDPDGSLPNVDRGNNFFKVR